MRQAQEQGAKELPRPAIDTEGRPVCPHCGCEDFQESWRVGSSAPLVELTVGADGEVLGRVDYDAGRVHWDDVTDVRFECARCVAPLAIAPREGR